MAYIAGREMKMKLMLSSVLVFAVLSVGCATKQQCPKIPETACRQCWAQTKDKTSDVVDTAAYVAVEGTSLALEYLQKSEKYLSEKIEEWKATHPEWVADAQARLDAIRTKMREKANELRSRSF